MHAYPHTPDPTLTGFLEDVGAKQTGTSGPAHSHLQRRPANVPETIQGLHVATLAATGKEA